jgi:hypothetical protein
MKTSDQMTFNCRKTIHAVQKEFNERFPFLKLEFFYPGNPNEVIKEKYKTLLEYGTRIPEPNMTITLHTKVSELKKYFEMIYGLPTQVFRKNQHKWISTNENENWTLEEQDLVGQWSNKEPRYSMILFPAA